MAVGPISYLTTRELIEQARTQEKHALPPELSHILSERIAGLTDEETIAFRASSLLAQVLDVCFQLHDAITRRPRYPRLPTDPHERERVWHEAVGELVQWWGYRDITEQVRQLYEQNARADGKPSLFDYRIVFQNPASVYYIRTLADLLILLDDARQTAAKQQQHETDLPREEDDDAPRC